MRLLNALDATRILTYSQLIILRSKDEFTTKVVNLTVSPREARLMFVTRLLRLMIRAI